MSVEWKDGAFAPPEEPVMVECLHCGARYLSSEMVWELRPAMAGVPLWWCRDPACNGAGFGFDLFQVVP